MQRFSKLATKGFPSLRSGHKAAVSGNTKTVITATTAPAAARRLSTTAPQAKAAATETPIKAESVLDLVKNRRTYYQLNKELTVAEDRIQEIVKESLLHVPSAFNSQTTRVVVLFGAEHDKFWSIVTGVLKGIVPEKNWESTGQRMNMFQGGAGTILFFEDQTVVQDFQSKFAMYADKLPIWAAQSDGMLQHTLWVALEAEGLGANLQHYNPIIDDKVAAEWGLPSSWKLNAQLVFGGRAGEPGEKTFAPLEDRLKVFGA